MSTYLSCQGLNGIVTGASGGLGTPESLYAKGSSIAVDGGVLHLALTGDGKPVV